MIHSTYSFIHSAYFHPIQSTYFYPCPLSPTPISTLSWWFLFHFYWEIWNKRVFPLWLPSPPSIYCHILCVLDLYHEWTTHTKLSICVLHYDPSWLLKNFAPTILAFFPHIYIFTLKCIIYISIQTYCYFWNFWNFYGSHFACQKYSIIPLNGKYPQESCLVHCLKLLFLNSL